MKNEIEVAEREEVETAKDTANETEVALPPLSEAILKPLRVKLEALASAEKELERQAEMTKEREAELEEQKTAFANATVKGESTDKLLEELARTQLRFEIMPKVTAQLEAKRERAAQAVAEKIGEVLPAIQRAKHQAIERHQHSIATLVGKQCQRALKDRASSRCIIVERAIETIAQLSDAGLALSQIDQDLTVIYGTTTEARVQHAGKMGRKLIALAEELLSTDDLSTPKPINAKGGR